MVMYGSCGKRKEFGPFFRLFLRKDKGRGEEGKGKVLVTAIFFSRTALAFFLLLGYRRQWYGKNRRNRAEVVIYRDGVLSPYLASKAQVAFFS